MISLYLNFGFHFEGLADDALIELFLECRLAREIQILFAPIDLYYVVA